MRKKYLVLATIIIFFLICRLSFLYFATGKVFYLEELCRWFIAKQLIEGPILPFFDLQCDHYSGGSLVVGMLAVPLFIVFGQNLVSFKLVSLLFFLATLIILYLLCDRFFNTNTAIVTCLLFTLSPTVFSGFSLITMGFHSESIFFSILAIFIFYEIFFRGKRNVFYFIFFGLISGLGTWFCYIFAITLFVCLLFWYFFDRYFFLQRDFIIFLVSFVIGFSPWIYYNVTHGFDGTNLVFANFSGTSKIYLLTRIKKIITFTLPNAFLFENLAFLSGRLLAFTYYFIFLLSFVLLSWLSRRSLYKLFLALIPLKRFQVSPEYIAKESFFLVYTVIFFLAYSYSSFGIGAITRYAQYRYLLPLLSIIFILISLSLNRIRQAKNKFRFLGLFLVLILLIIGLGSNFKLISLGADRSLKKNNVQFYTSKINYMAGVSIGSKFGEDINKSCSLIGRFEEKDRIDFSKGLGSGIGIRRRSDPNESVDLISKASDRYKLYLYEGLGNGLAYKLRNDKMAISLIPRIEEKYRPDFCRGLGWGYVDRFDEREIDKYMRLLERIDERWRPYFCEGLGYGLAWGLGLSQVQNSSRSMNLINKFEEQYRPHIYKGLGEGFMIDSSHIR